MLQEILSYHEAPSPIRNYRYLAAIYLDMTTKNILAKVPAHTDLVAL